MKRNKINFFKIIVLVIFLSIIAVIGFITYQFLYKQDSQVFFDVKDSILYDSKIIDSNQKETDDKIIEYAHKDFSFFYPKSWTLYGKFEKLDDNPSSIDLSLEFSSSNNEKVSIRVYEDSNQSFEQLSDNPNFHTVGPVDFQEGMIDGNQFLSKQYNNEPYLSPNPSFFTIIFKCGNDVLNFEYYSISEKPGRDIKDFLNILRSFDCHFSQGETTLPRVNEDIFDFKIAE